LVLTDHWNPSSDHQFLDLDWKDLVIARVCLCWGTPGLWILGLVATGLAACCEAHEPLPIGMQWRQLPSVPDARGVAAPFAGVQGTTLLVGGGANFPERPPWDGGTKVWYDRVWSLDRPDGTWREVGRLPRPLGYGVSISTADGVVCVGGSDAQRHYADVFQLTCRGGILETKSLPPLPRPVANACGALLGQTIYVTGGLESPNATGTLSTFFSLDLGAKELQWKELETWPGPPRMLAVAAVQDGSFFVVSGTDLSANEAGKPQRRYLRDAYRYTPGTGWKRIADLPQPVVAAPSPAPTWGTAQFLVIGGDDGSQVGFQPPSQHPGFPKRVLAYSTTTNTWDEVGTTPAPRVTVPTVQWGEQWLIVSGEQRPGVRSPEVWSLHVRPAE
jgi:N-acetylneuraminate epimerase